MEVLEWTMVGAEELRRRRPHELERQRLRVGNAG